MSDWIIVYEKNKKYLVSGTPGHVQNATEAKKYAKGCLQRRNNIDNSTRTLVDIVYMNSESAKFDNFVDNMEELYE